jgi:hypothetical protein
MHNTKLKAYTHNNNILLATINTLETKRLTFKRLRMGDDERERERGGVTTFRIIIATEMKMGEKKIKL